MDDDHDYGDNTAAAQTLLGGLTWTALTCSAGVIGYVTGSEKTGLIYIKYTCPYYGIYLLFCVCYLNSISFIDFLRILYIYVMRFVKIVCFKNELLHFED